MPEALKAVMGLGKYARRCPNKHRKYFLLAQLRLAWCPACGAIRSQADGEWTAPKWRYPDA